MTETPETAVTVVGIDIGKNSFHVVGLDRRGSIVLRQKWSRRQVESRFANRSPCLIGMEACVGAHHLSRRLRALGHDARLMPAKYVRPYSKGQKNDFRDAEAIAEAVQRPTMKFVATKTVEQLDLQALHRVRERLVSQRTGIINQIRAFLLERGIAVRQGRLSLRAALPHLLAAPSEIVLPRMLHLIEDLVGDWRRLDERIRALSDEIETIARQDAGCARLMSVPGVGPIVSSAMVARSAREMPSPKVATSPLGSGSCPSKSPPGIARSWARYRSEAIATCVCCSFRRPGWCWSSARAGSVSASIAGSKLPRSGCTATSWRLRSLISWRALPGASWLMAGTSKARRSMRRPPNRLNRRARNEEPYNDVAQHSPRSARG
jgi:transposase